MWEEGLRLLVAVALCGIIGFEREIRDQPAGFRTHILLGLGAALFTLVSAYGFPEFTTAALESGGRGVQFGPTRIAAQIVTGVGFLGAGAIIRQGGDVRGLTTAASLWAAAAIGMAAGAGYLLGALLTTVLVMATLYALRFFRSAVISPLRLDYAELEFALSDPQAGPQEVLRILEDNGITVRDTEAALDGQRARYKLQIRVPASQSVHEVLVRINAVPNLERVTLVGLRDYEQRRGPGRESRPPDTRGIRVD